MFSIPEYPTEPIKRVEWCLQFETNIMHYIHQIYFEDMYYNEYPYSFVLHTTFRTIYQLLEDMRTYITAVNTYIEKEKYLSCLISADQLTEAIRPITERVKMHEMKATEIYKKYWKLYQEDPPLVPPTYLPVELEEEQKDFQIM